MSMQSLAMCQTACFKSMRPGHIAPIIMQNPVLPTRELNRPVDDDEFHAHVAKGWEDDCGLYVDDSTSFLYVRGWRCIKFVPGWFSAVQPDLDSFSISQF